MKRFFLAGTAVLAMAAAAPASAQHGGHGQHSGHGQDQQPKAEPPAQAEDHSAHQPAPPAAEQPQQAPVDHSGHDMAGAEHEAAGHEMTGALGSYPMNREASGTSWQPDAGSHQGVHLSTGGWMLMGHALLNGVYSRQEGPRGDEKAFVSGMVMGSARRDFANGNTLQFRAMLSPDPLMGRRGYPLLLATGETADGLTPLVDRQHPHDLFVELSASYSVRFSDQGSFFLYGGLPGEPAFGPPAFMHRMSIMDSPEAPITHHWLDSTHITFGVLTAGLIYDGFKVEASRFNGREPDQKRYNIETGPLDSTSARLSWNPTDRLSLQASWARLIAPEQLEPDENETRWSASGIYTQAIGEEGWWSTTLAWGRRESGHEKLDAFVLEGAVGLKDWTLFGRAEQTENNELLSVGGHHGPAYDVAKVSLGAIRDFRIAGHVKIGVGALYAFNFVPAALEQSYGGNPSGAMTFVRLKID